MFRAEVEDMNASLEFPNQTDFGVLQNYFVFFCQEDFWLFNRFFPIAEVAIYVQAHTDNGPIFSPPWSPAHPIIRAEVVEEQDPGIIFLTLQVEYSVAVILLQCFITWFPFRFRHMTLSRVC